MEEEQERQEQKVKMQRAKYQVGNANKGGAAFNILNLQYDNTHEGGYLASKDNDAKVRGLMRSKHIDSLGNNNYNLLNGNARTQIDVPNHGVYNPPGSSGSTLGTAGYNAMGGGRPTRGMEKQFGKKVVAGYGVYDSSFKPPSSQMARQAPYPGA